MHRTFARSLVAASAFTLSWLGSVAEAPTAQAQGVPTADFSTLRFSPAPGANNYTGVDGARVQGNADLSAGFLLDYAHEPFTLYNAACTGPDATNCEVTGTRSRIVSYTAAAHLWAAFAISHRLQVAIIAPLVYTQGETFNPSTTISLRGGDAFALADPRLHLKLNIIDDNGGFRLGAVGYVTFPIGHAIAPGRYIGDEDPTFGGHLVAEFVRSGFHIAANVGGVWRDGDVLFSTSASSQFTYGAAMGYELTPLVSLHAEVQGGTSFTSQVDENSLEARLAGRIRVGDVVIDLGAGAGLIAGVGVPVFRGFGGLSYLPHRIDEDGDGLTDDLDGCPTDAEDLDGFEDEDGCPDPDNDGDGVEDGRDQCPTAAEDMDGEEDTDGCPDLDTDGDGVQDGYDSCPTEPEDRDGDRDEDGCPDNDRDRDNIPDESDQCPDQPEDTDGFGDEDGCPETDFDGDGVPDDGDACADQAEDMDGFEDEDGCPEEGGPPTGDGPRGGRRARGR